MVTTGVARTRGPMGMTRPRPGWTHRSHLAAFHVGILASPEGNPYRARPSAVGGTRSDPRPVTIE